MNKFFAALLLAATLTACTKQNEIFTTAPLADYFPLKVGKFISYRLDSTVYINFGQKDTVITYQVKDTVETQITDNLGRPAFRIVRYFRKNSTQPWVANNTFMAIASGNTMEFVENNLRFQKLQLPIKDGYSWKGNKYIDAYSLNSSVKYLDDWNYMYDSVNVPLTINGFNFPSTLKVEQRDEFLGQDPKIPNTQYAERNYSVEKYAKNTGLVYKEFLHWEYQGTQPGRQAFYSGYGVKLTVTGYN